MLDAISFWLLYGATTYITGFIVIVALVYLGSAWLDKITNKDFRLYDKSEDFLFKCAPFIRRDNAGGMAILFIVSFIMLVTACMVMYLPNAEGITLTLHDFISDLATFMMPCGIYVTAIFAAVMATSWLSKAYDKVKGLKYKLDKLK